MRIGRIGAALLWDAGLKLQAAPLPEEKLKAVSAMLDHHIACPNASSMGRLFDGAASLLLGLSQITFDGEGAMKVEALAEDVPVFHKDSRTPYPVTFYMDQQVRRFDTRPLIRAVVSDIEQHVSGPVIAGRFMETLCHMALLQTKALNSRHLPVVLSGGVFQNRFLLSGIKQLLTLHGFTVYTHDRISPGDEGLSLGQLFIGANARPGMEPAKKEGI